MTSTAWRPVGRILALMLLGAGLAAAQAPADPPDPSMQATGGDAAQGDPAYAADPAALNGAPTESVDVAPPDLPNYDQPPLPGDGYVWTPGYWAWSEADQDYYWVPGTWVLPPQPDLLWTPGYWIVQGPVFAWYPGYWGPHVGYYGGIDYGYGYGGHGYQGGYWRGGRFCYNRNVTNLGTVRPAAVYQAPANVGTRPRRHSYTGGGTSPAAATAAELAVARERHWAPVPGQLTNERVASRDVTTHLSYNAGVPAVAATPRAGAFSAPGTVSARPATGTFSVIRTTPAAQPAVAAPRPGSRSVTSAPRTGTRPVVRGEAPARGATVPGTLVPGNGSPGTFVPGSGRDPGARPARPADTYPALPHPPPPPPQAPPVPRAPARNAEPARMPPRMP